MLVPSISRPNGRTYSLVQHNLGLIQLLLNLHNTVGLLRVLVLHNVFLQLRQGACALAQGRVRPRCAGVLCEELVDDLGKELMGNQRRVIAVGDDHTGHTLGPAVSVKCV